jgi:hypothetical protein
MRKKYGLHGYLNKWFHDTMDFKEAKNQLIKTYLEINNSGPIYREDNQQLLNESLGIEKKKFYSVRNQLAKSQMRGELKRSSIIKEFNKLFV